jgi:hypothetical protein
VTLIDSNPAGATVYLDSHPVPGTTPVEFELDWYGPHTVTLVRDGYPPSKQVIDVKCPVYLWIPLDLFVTLLPFPVTDRHEYHFDLTEDQTKKE